MVDIRPRGRSSRRRYDAAPQAKATEFFALKQQNPIAHLSVLRGDQKSKRLLTEGYLSPTLHNVPDNYIRFLRSQLQYALQVTQEGMHQQAWYARPAEQNLAHRRLAELLQDHAQTFMDGFFHYKQQFDARDHQRELIENVNQEFGKRISEVMAKEGWGQRDWGEIQVALCRERLEGDDEEETRLFLNAGSSTASTVVESVFDGDDEDEDEDDYDHIYSFEDPPIADSMVSAAAQPDKLEQNAELMEPTTRPGTPLPFTVPAKSVTTNWAEEVAAPCPSQLVQSIEPMEIDVEPTPTPTHPIPINSSSLTSRAFYECYEDDQSILPNAKRQKLGQMPTTHQKSRRNSGLEARDDLLAQLRTPGDDSIQDTQEFDLPPLLDDAKDPMLDYISKEFGLDSSDSEDDESDNISTAPSTLDFEMSPGPDFEYTVHEHRDTYLNNLLCIRAEVKAEMEAELEVKEVKDKRNMRNLATTRSRECFTRHLVSLRLQMWRNGLYSTDAKTNTSFTRTSGVGSHSVEFVGALKEYLEDEELELRALVEFAVRNAKENGDWYKHMKQNAMRSLVKLSKSLPTAIKHTGLRFRLRSAVREAQEVRSEQTRQLWADLSVAVEEAEDMVETILDSYEVKMELKALLDDQERMQLAKKARIGGSIVTRC